MSLSSFNSETIEEISKEVRSLDSAVYETENLRDTIYKNRNLKVVREIAGSEGDSKDAVNGDFSSSDHAHCKYLGSQFLIFTRLKTFTRIYDKINKKRFTFLLDKFVCSLYRSIYRDIILIFYSDKVFKVYEYTKDFEWRKMRNFNSNIAWQDFICYYANDKDATTVLATDSNSSPRKIAFFYNYETQQAELSDLQPYIEKELYEVALISNVQAIELGQSIGRVPNPTEDGFRILYTDVMRSDTKITFPYSKKGTMTYVGFVDGMTHITVEIDNEILLLLSRNKQ